MPQSPFQELVHPPNMNIEKFRRDLAKARVECEDGARGLDEEELVDIGEIAFEHCDFLERKLEAKKREYAQLTMENQKVKKDNGVLQKVNEALRNENETMRNENDFWKVEVAALEGKLKKAAGPAATTTAKGEPENGWLDAIFPFLSRCLFIRSADPSEAVNPRKRGAKADPATGEKAAKKGKK
ncbi:hypothetical protein MMC30_004106 [Trapelia coarctata]|nr:hypothetical protein [Trapelia coarctata]